MAVLGAMGGIGACTGAQEPPKVATVSTELPVASVSAAPSDAPSPSLPASAAPSGELTALPSSSARAATPPTATARTPEDHLSDLEIVMLQALGTSGVTPGGSASTGALNLGTGLGGSSGGGLAGIASLTAPVGSTSSGKVTGPTIVVSLGAVKVTGGTIANASAVTAAMAAGFRRCLYRALATDPTSLQTGASARLLAVVGSAGEVLSTSLRTSQGIPAPSLSCMQARVGAAIFAAPSPGGATVEIPVTVQIVP